MGKTDLTRIPEFETDGPGYEEDFHAWLGEQGRRLRLLRIPGIDSENLAEEIESLGRSQRNELISRMDVLLTHLLEWQHQPERRGNSWRATIRAQRKDLSLLLDTSPSLRRLIAEVIAREYSYAVEQAALETGLAESVFPPVCEWSEAEVMSPAFLPD